MALSRSCWLTALGPPASLKSACTRSNWRRALAISAWAAATLARAWAISSGRLPWCRRKTTCCWAAAAASACSPEWLQPAHVQRRQQLPLFHAVALLHENPGDALVVIKRQIHLPQVDVAVQDQIPLLSAAGEPPPPRPTRRTRQNQNQQSFFHVAPVSTIPADRAWSQKRRAAAAFSGGACAGCSDGESPTTPLDARGSSPAAKDSDHTLSGSPRRPLPHARTLPSQHFLNFFPLPHGTGVVAAHALLVLLPLFVGQHLHDLRRRPALPQKLRHRLHVRIDVIEKPLVCRAKIVEPLFPVGGAVKRCLGHSPLQAKRTSHWRQ